MSKQVDVKNSSSIVAMSREQAVEQFKEAEKLLNLARPKSLDSIQLRNNSSYLKYLIYSGVIGGVSFVGFLVNDTLSIIDSTLFNSFLLAGSILPITHLGMTMIPDDEDFNSKNKLFQLARRLLLFKPQQKIIKKQLKEINEHKQSMEIYRILVDKVSQELEYSGVLELLNNFEDPENQNFATLNKDTGVFEYISRRQIMEKKEKEEQERKESVKQIETSVKTKTTISILSDEDNLLGNGRDFKELFS